MRGMLRILRRLEMVSRVDPIAWNSYSRSEDQQTHDTGANLVAHSGTHPGHYAPPVAPQWLAPLVRLSTRKVSQKIGDLRVAEKSHRS